MTPAAHGTFQINLTPHAPAPASSPDTGRMPIHRHHFDKTWSGDLGGQSQGEMLSVGNPASGTASYVVLEVFSGTLAGRRGTFAFRQSGDMHAGQTSLTYEVVPHSGGGELSGLSGTLSLNRVEGVHHYELDYTIQSPEAQS